jgi:hypothetical protein
MTVMNRRNPVIPRPAVAGAHAKEDRSQAMKLGKPRKPRAGAGTKECMKIAAPNRIKLAQTRRIGARRNRAFTMPLTRG